MKNLFLICLVLMIQSSQALASPNTPESWYRLPESNSGQEPNRLTESEDTTQLEKTVDAVFRANQQALEGGISANDSVTSSFFAEKKPKDWVPWRAEIFTTDLSLSVGGLLGALFAKGTATVRAYWRKQYPANPAESVVNLDDKESSEGVIRFSEESTDIDIRNQIESVIAVAVKAKKVEDTPVLRHELFKVAGDFQNLASGLNETSQDLPWWVSRFRLDFNVDASGHVHPNVTVGGEVRFRFEWHRIKRKSPSPAFVAKKRLASEILNQPVLATFVRGISEDLDLAFSHMPEHDFQAYTFRVGIGLTVKGEIGVIKGSAGVVGQIYFLRDVKRPKQNPKPAFVSTEQPLLIIERNPSSQNLSFAKSKKIKFELNSIPNSGANFVDPISEVVYKASRDQFRKGLKKAAKITTFFTDRAAKQKATGWKIFELRTAFDSSVTGELSMASIVGSVTAQVAFYNQKF